MRTWFAHLPPNRAVRGGLVIDLQLLLARAGLLASVDGIFAGQTAGALRLWQAGKALTPSGAVDELTWQGLTASPAPSLFRRCLSLTAAFEGHGYTLGIGNFDGAYLTWGIIGFTLKHGNVGEVIKRIEARHPALLTETIGSAKAAALSAIVRDSDAKRRAFGDSISAGPNKTRLLDDWRDAFEALGNRREVRAIQDEVAHDVYWARAAKDLRAHGRMTELDAALFFDTAVQNGGVDAAKAAAIKAALMNAPGLTTRQRLQRTAEAIAAKSKPAFQADVLSRRGTIASGTGAVHGASYLVGLWGLDDFPVTPTDLA